MTATLLCVDPIRIPDIWPHVEPLIASAYRKVPTDDSLEALLTDLKSNKALLWIVWEEPKIIAAAATRLIATHGRGLICVIAACGGFQLPKWSKFIDALERYARTEGCTALRFSGRKGWRKAFPQFHEPWITMEKDLT